MCGSSESGSIFTIGNLSDLAVRQPIPISFIKGIRIAAIQAGSRDSITPRGEETPNLSLTQVQFDELILAGADRLLARATNKRALDGKAIRDRLCAAAQKYVLKHEPSADAATIGSFLDGLHADDLVLVLACERGDQNAWSDLFEGYGATVRSAARGGGPTRDRPASQTGEAGTN